MSTAGMALTFHHLGLAGRDVSADVAAFRLLGYEPEGDEFVDHGQGITGRFIVGPGPRIEVLAALPGSSVLDPWLEKGVKFYHEAFQVADLDDALAGFRDLGARVVSPPAPAAAFGGRPIAFVLLRNMALVEFIQRAPADG